MRRMKDNWLLGLLLLRRATVTSIAGTGALIWLLVASQNSNAAIAYVQSKSTSQNNSSQSSLTATFSSAQVAVDLNVVAVGWGSTSIGISSVTDTKGNTYTLAVGPTASTSLGSASIYYAKNIVAAAAGANIVTVTFSGGVPFPDVRIAERSGISTTAPLDVSAVATGTGTTGPGTGGRPLLKCSLGREIPLRDQP